MKKKYKVTFLNHASFAIEVNNNITLIDPWFTGKIFNNSWSLMKDTDDSIIDYSKVKYISISHEHPDHLHWGTLKYIRSKTDNDITIIYPKRKNPNVKDACKKLGYSFAYVEHFTETEIEENYSITTFPAGHDSALVYRVHGDVICNQNDAYLKPDNLQTMHEMFPNIDLWLFQFSLAGYYGNMTEPEVIKEKGTKFHIDKFLEYQRYLQPKMSIPFASFVYFCKEYNKYINDYAVSLESILEKSNLKTQIPFYGEEISLVSNENNDNYLAKWKDVIDSSTRVIDPVQEFVGEEKIIELLHKITKEGYNPAPLILEFFDYDRYLFIDTERNNFKFIDKKEVSSDLIAGTLPTEELYAYLTTPWGADTLNITGAFIKKSMGLWHSFIASRDLMYSR